MSLKAWFRGLLGGPCWSDTGERRKEVLYSGPLFRLERLQGREVDDCFDVPYAPALMERWVPRPKTAVAVFQDNGEVIPLADDRIEPAAFLFNHLNGT